MADDSINFQFTAKGQQLASQALAGTVKLDFTKAVASTDNHFSDSVATIAALTTLANVKQTATISEVDRVAEDDTEVRIPVTFDKSQVGDDYQLLTVGLYCKPDNGAEVLYAVAGLANPILMHKSLTSSVYSIAMYVLVGTANSVTIKVDPAGSVTQADLTAVLANYVLKSDIKTVAYTDKANTFTQKQTLSGGAVDGAGHAYVTEDKVPKTDLSGVQPKGDYATNPDLNALKNTVNTKANASDMTALQGQVKANTSSLSTKMTTVDADNKYLSINQAATTYEPKSDTNRFETSAHASSTYETQADAKNKVDLTGNQTIVGQKTFSTEPVDKNGVAYINKQNAFDKTEDLIGGRNLILSSNDFSNVVLWSENGTILCSDDGKSLTVNSSHGTGVFGTKKISKDAFNKGDVLTISVEAYGTNQLEINFNDGSHFIWGLGERYDISSTPKRYSKTFLYNPVDESQISFAVGGYGSETGSVTISKIKLEKGTVPTDWSPAPEDLEAYTDDAKQSAISQATTLANNAKQAAINQAHTDVLAELTKRGYPTAIWTGTQAQYDAMASHDEHTEYRIFG